MAFFRPYKNGWRAEVARHNIRKSRTFNTKAQAVAWAGKLEAEIIAGARGEIPNLTVQALLTRYIKEVSVNKKGKRWEEIRLKALGRDRLSKVRLRSLDAPHVSDWQQRRLEAVSSASVRRERNLLNNVFEIARKEWKWLTKNPFLGVRRPKDGKSRTRLATDAEIELLLAGASADLSRAISIALETGMRASEIASKPKITGRVAVLLDSKNGESREVPMSAAAAKLFPVGLTTGSISALFARACKDAKIEGLTFHDLRHHAATRLAKTLSLFDLCKVMGWKDPRHALLYYNATAADIAEKL